MDGRPHMKQCRIFDKYVISKNVTICYFSTIASGLDVGLLFLT